MTSAATVAGHFPLVLVSGPGAAARNSIGLVLVGGMTVGTFFTLFVIPSIYMLIAQEKHKAVAEIDPESLENINAEPRPAGGPA
jgi:multidrug efflux pump